MPRVTLLPMKRPSKTLEAKASSGRATTGLVLLAIVFAQAIHRKRTQTDPSDQFIQWKSLNRCSAEEYALCHSKRSSPNQNARGAQRAIPSPTKMITLPLSFESSARTARNRLAPKRQWINPRGPLGSNQQAPRVPGGQTRCAAIDAVTIRAAEDHALAV